MSSLLPCPFCGGDPETDHQQAFRWLQGGKLDHAAAIYCTTCNANMTICRGDTTELSDEERMIILVENWNRRSTLKPEGEQKSESFIKWLKQLKYAAATEYGEGYNAAVDLILSEAISTLKTEHINDEALDRAKKAWWDSEGQSLDDMLRAVLETVYRPSPEQISGEAVERACKAMAITIAKQDGVVLTDAGYEQGKAARPEQHAQMQEYVRAALNAAIGAR